MDDLFSVAGRVAVVTGGSRGIGLMIARGFVEAGARVYICSRSAADCDRAAAGLAGAGECVPLPADLSTLAGIEAFVAALGEREPAIHVLVNNAGVATGAPIDGFPEEYWDRVLDINTKSVFFLISRMLPLLRSGATAESPGRVINIGSVDGLSTPPVANFAYSASKAAVHMMTRHVAAALVGDHINVNAIAPGLFHTAMTRRTFEETDPFGRIASVPMGRTGTPEDIAGTAIYLASRASSFMTGAVLPLGGGFATIDRQGR